MRFARATSLDHALDALASATSDTRVLAGGTDLLVEIESGRTRPDFVVDVRSIGELRSIGTVDVGGGVHELEIGALATCTDLVRSPLVREHASVLVEAAWTVGAEQIRNRATIGGNLGTASPAADLTPVLLAVGASVELRSRRGTRKIALEAFLTGYRATARTPDELITRVRVPFAARGERRGFRKVGTRRAQSISKLVLALGMTVEDGRVRALRGAAGSLAERTILLPSLVDVIGANVDDPRELDRVIRLAARRSALSDVRPRDDVRSTAEYRRAVHERVLVRLLHDLASGTSCPTS
jgi:CO/xanthine dehydrogenase FAD-binding subunit